MERNRRSEENRRPKENSKPYVCPNCGWTPGNAFETERTHCPNCLSAVHEEDGEGFSCGGILEPVSIWVKPDGKWEIIGRCRLCGGLSAVPAAPDDNPMKILSIASKPLSAPPFPIEKVEELTRMMGGQGSLGGYKK